MTMATGGPLLPALFAAFRHPAANVRKATVMSLVALSLVRRCHPQATDPTGLCECHSCSREMLGCA